MDNRASANSNDHLGFVIINPKSKLYMPINFYTNEQSALQVIQPSGSLTGAA